MSVLIETSLGGLVVDLLVDDCPIASRNFLKLCKAKYYNNCLFFNIQKDFVAQTGDPTGTGNGGSSFDGFLASKQQAAEGGKSKKQQQQQQQVPKTFKDEIRGDIKHDRIGTIGYASTGPDQNASQFYITLRPQIEYLDKKKTIFGHVEEGLEVLQEINKAFCDQDGRPYQDIRIRHTHIVFDPFPDPSDFSWPASPQRYRPAEETVDPRIADDEDVDDNDGRTQEEIEADMKKESARANATALVLMGDLPHADVRPEENILFVCKLNPVTTDEDLELIFSRFGDIKRCDIIKDHKTGDSLQYAFIEFSSREECERAYFKMNNVLIDDHRIKVDFNQSTSKVWNKYKMQPWIQKLRQYEREKAGGKFGGAGGNNANEVPIGKRRDAPAPLAAPASTARATPTTSTHHSASSSSARVTHRRSRSRSRDRKNRDRDRHKHRSRSRDRARRGEDRRGGRSRDRDRGKDRDRDDRHNRQRDRDRSRRGH